MVSRHPPQRPQLFTGRFTPLPRPDNRGMNTPSLDGGASRFIALDEAAHLLGISADHAEALVTSGELPAIRLETDGVWRIDRAVLERYIEALYEETRRRNLWNGSNLASIDELP